MRQTAARSTVNKQFINPTRVEADQKDIIINKLKLQLESLKKNESQLTTIQQQYADLNRKYRAQQQQKNIQDANFKNKHDCALRHIGQLKNQVDAIKSELRDKKLQIQDLKVDQENMRNFVDQRNIQLQKLRNQINAALCDSDQLQNQRIMLLQQSQSLKNNKALLSEDFFNLQKQNEGCEKRLGQMQSYLSQLDDQSNILKQKIRSYEDTNNNLDIQIQQASKQVSQLNQMINDCQQDCSSFQIANASLSTNADQFKSQSTHNQKACHNQVMKNNQLNKKIKQAQHALGIRLGQVNEGISQIDALKEQNQNLHHSNNNLFDDLQACRKHLQNLGLLNQHLTTLLCDFSQQDKQVRQLINRQQRVKQLSNQVQQVCSIQFNQSKQTARTDVSFRTSRRLRF